MQAAARRAPPSAKSEKAAAPRGAARLKPEQSASPTERRDNPLWSALALREQPSILISAPGDASEREADRVADSITRMPVPVSAEVTSITAGVVQRKCAACEAGGASCATCEEERGFLQRKTDGGDPRPATAAFSAPLGSGTPLDAGSRAFFEPRFHRGFGDVRVHADADATAAARGLHARAFTVGSHIVFGAGEYEPHTTGGRELLAHELTHVLQQRAQAGMAPTIQRQPTEPEPFRLDAPDPAGENVSWAEPEPENLSWGEPVPVPDVPEAVCRPEQDLVCEREGPPEPLGATIEFEDVVFAANPDYLDWLLRREVRLFGLVKTAALVDRFLRSQGILVPGALMPPASADEAARESGFTRTLRQLQESVFAEIPLAVHASFLRVQHQVSAYLESYKSAAEANLLTLLHRSEARIDAERIRYGLQSKEDILHYWSPLRLDAEMRKNPGPEDVVPALKELATAAGILYRLKLQLDVTDTQRDITRAQDLSRMFRTSDVTTWQSSYRSLTEQTTDLRDKKRVYEFQKAELTERYPVLAAYENDSKKLQLLASGSPVDVIVQLHDKIYEILTNIASVREDVNDHDINIWKLPRLISATNLSLGIEEGSFEDALIKQKVKDENDESFWRSIGLAVLQVGLVLLAPVTGGLSLIAAAGISGGMLAHSVKEYSQQKALAGTDFDRALAIASEEPSLFWVAMDAVLFIPDAFGALKAFRVVKELLPAYRAATSADEAAAILGRLEHDAPAAAKGGLEGDAALRAEAGGKAFAQRVVEGAQAGQLSGLRRVFSAADAEALEAAGEAAARTVTGAVLFERVTVAGTLKITPGGHMVVCASPCRWLRDVFAPALAKNPDLEARLVLLEDDLQGALARTDHGAVADLGIHTQTLMRDLVKETVGDLPLNPAQLKILNEIEGALEAHGRGWTDLGFRDRSELVKVLNTPGRVDEVLAGLRKQASFADLVAAEGKQLRSLGRESIERLSELEPAAAKRLLKLDPDTLAKVAVLKPYDLTKLSQLEQAAIEKLAKLDPQSLRYVADLSAPTLEWLARLKPAAVAKIAEAGITSPFALRQLVEKIGPRSSWRDLKKALAKAERHRAQLEKAFKASETGDWGKISGTDRSSIGRHIGYELEELTRVAYRGRAKTILNYEHVNKRLITKLEKDKGRVLITQGQLKGGDLRFDIAEIDFDKKTFALIDLAPHSNPVHLAGTELYQKELQKLLPGFTPVASELHYVGTGGEVLEDLAEKLVP